MIDYKKQNPVLFKYFLACIKLRSPDIFDSHSTEELELIANKCVEEFYRQETESNLYGESDIEPTGLIGV